jgi:hypothetical protein
MPNGDLIDSSSTFLSIRSRYKQDPDWPKMQAFLAGVEGQGFVIEEPSIASRAPSQRTTTLSSGGRAERQ